MRRASMFAVFGLLLAAAPRAALCSPTSPGRLEANVEHNFEAEQVLRDVRDPGAGKPLAALANLSRLSVRVEPACTPTTRIAFVITGRF